MRIISADLKQEKGKLNRYFSTCIGAGRAGEVMRHVATKQLELVQKECPFEYIRFHGLFHEEMNIVHRDENGKLSFCFQYIDLLFDSLLEMNIRPIVELGLMPKIMAEDEYTVFWWSMSISMPKMIEEWAELIEATVRHFTYRYGEDEVKKWYFEVWNEPNLPFFFSGASDINKYFKLYDYAAFAVKKVNPAYRVGGPATAELAWIPDLIAHCKENAIPLDFISSHYYCTEGAFDADGTCMLYIKPSEHFTNAVKKVGELCKKEGYPFLMTEFSSSFSPRDAVHDSYFNAPLILNFIKKCEGYADMMSYWTYTDIFEEPGPPNTLFHGGFGLITVQSMPKPTYYAYTFLNRLGDTELSCNDPSSYICKKEDEVQVLFWNTLHPDTDTHNNEYFTRPLPAKEIDDAKIALSGFKVNKKYTVNIETIGYRSGDVYNEYLCGNYTELPTREETAALIESSKPKKTTFEVTSDENGTIEFFVKQKENQVDLVTIGF